MSVEGKVVVVTGGAQGIGRHVVRTFAQAGAKIAVADIAPFDNVLNDVDKIGAEILPVRTDVRDEDSVRNLFKTVWWKYGSIDALVNDAGIVTHFQWGLPRWNRIRYMEKSFFDNVINTNLGGTFLTIKHVLPYMEDQLSGHIISFGQGSLSGPRPDSIGAAVYGTSKLSIRAFTRFVAEEEREFNICVISMGPGGGGGGGERSAADRGIATEEAPIWARERMRGVDVVGNRYVLGAEAPMELSGNQVTVADGKLVAMKD